MATYPTILISCGEASGDLHAAALVTEILKRNPDARIIAFGGDRVAQAGAELVSHIDRYAVMGFSSVLASITKFARLEKKLRSVLRNGVDLFIPVDYPGLNIRLSGYAKKLGVPVLYYISPQVWAWGAGRIREIGRSVDRIAVILPFEEEIYKREGIPVEYVGHPFVEDHYLPEPVTESEREGVGLLPGSRLQEIRRILPVLLGAARYITERRPGTRFVIGRHPTVPLYSYEKVLTRFGMDIPIDNDAVAVMRRSRAILVASGTATLQGALFETPLVIVYRISAINYLLARKLVKIRNIGLVNIIFNDGVCPEFIQSSAVPERIGKKALELIDDNDSRRIMVDRFKSLKHTLSGGGGCRRVAEISEEMLRKRR
ncbi:MAG: lipid-A-disaccharide synthase [Candidatus Latescibacteria bacterium]|nr:lipid-A-disaccharide synthase [Candidatus Latescibacterota bacterium]